MKKEIKILLCVIVLFCAILSLLLSYVSIQKDRITYYERVMKEFEIGEFIDHWELFYDEGYIEQVKTHNCMWSIEETIDCHNKLEEFKKEYNIAECPQDGPAACWE